MAFLIEKVLKSMRTITLGVSFRAKQICSTSTALPSSSRATKALVVGESEAIDWAIAPSDLYTDSLTVKIGLGR